MLCCPTSGESFTTKSSHTSDFQTCKTYYSCLKYLILDNACDIIQSQPKLNCQSEVRIFEVKNEKYPKFTLAKEYSLSAQVSYYSKMIQSHNGWMCCGVYSDEAVTGTKGERAGFQHMIEECRQGNIDLVITKSISRFARNTVTLLQTVRELKSLGVDVFFEEQHIHTMSTDGELMMTILASYAQEESLSASENQKWRVRKAFENGEIANYFSKTDKRV